MLQSRELPTSVCLYKYSYWFSLFGKNMLLILTNRRIPITWYVIMPEEVTPLLH
jgi:hypothetical protein